MSGDVPTAEQPTRVNTELETKDDPLADRFIWAFPVALLALLATLAALIA